MTRSASTWVIGKGVSLALSKIILASIALFLAGSLAYASDLSEPIGRPDRPEGIKDAPVVLIEYSSPTCHHCVDYRNNVAPRIEADFIRTGKVKLLFRPFVRNNVDMAIFMLAEGLPPERYDQFIASFYHHYDEIAISEDLEATIRGIAQDNGISEDEFNRLLKNQGIMDELQSETKQAVADFSVRGTPSFFVNGKMIVGGLSYDEMKEQIETALTQSKN